MNKAMIAIMEFINDKNADACDFSIALENLLYLEYDVLEKEDAAANAILQNDVPELCAEVEPCDPHEPFARKLKAVYERALAASEAAKCKPLSAH